MAEHKPDGSDPFVPGITRWSPVGRGGFSTVYRGYQQRFDRWVAVKILDVERLDAASQRRFERECAIMGSLSNHPAVVTIYDSGSLADGRPYLLTEFCDGGSLAQLLDSSGALPAGQAIEIGYKLATALDAAHLIGIVHRDIKPGNVLLRRTGEPALSDFGLSFRDGQDASHGLDAFSLPYAAPEALAEGKYTPAGDVYALGSTLFALLTGVPPFPQRAGEGPMAYIHRVLADPPPVPRADLPPGLQQLLLDMLAKKPADRPAAPVVLDQLQALRRSGETADNPSLGTMANAGQERPADDAATEPHDLSWRPASAGAATQVHDDDRTSTTRLDSGQQTMPRLPPGWAGGPVRRRKRNLRLIGAAAAVTIGLVMGIALSVTLSADPRPPSTGPGVSIPDGYQLVDGPNGLAVAIPEGWEVKPARAASDRQADDPNNQDPNNPDRFVRFGGYRPETPEGPILDTVRDLERDVKRSAADYTRLRMQPIDYAASGEAIDWEFRFTRDGRSRRAYGRYWRVGDVRYVVYASGPEDEWERMRAVFEVMSATATPR